ncbi:hypothetical protein EVAR_82498_1 [Eumeta japonica]|uniref:Reverse transcriptase domain-containing protein n=1 Tax=Eumeta variegata TaxID=151549 RepID=A0A4C1UXL9_EUMVA|nr:hypothetical protein EVAR_82498_1 [Eumeta japonica]
MPCNISRPSQSIRPSLNFNFHLKLDDAGIRGLPHNLFTDYVSNRSQRVRIGDWLSDELPVTYGVPQSSVLSPTVILIYINKLCQLKLNQGRIFFFADDTALVFTSNTWQEIYAHAQLGSKMVRYWLAKNMLTLNVAKTKYMVFTQIQCSSS